ncbi:MAG: hypothetical protein ACTTIR_06105 [Eggerthia catenaformis]|uniref:hypothetical protein n=1 Tax=Eggerthia catenaformis TaxID=31973 RepID=UPI003F9F2B25
MMQAVKDNKVYTISEALKDSYLKQGFDIYDQDGKVEEYSPLKTVKYSEYSKLQKENENLKEQLEKLNPKPEEPKNTSKK